jgi:hypothetical protein
MPVNTCEMNVGCLMEIRVAGGYRGVSDVDQMVAMIKAHSGRLKPDEKFVIAADWRLVGVMSPETAIRAREMLALSNPRVIRSAILTAPEQSTANLQVVRLVREAENAERRHFTDPEAMRAWLAEVLTTDELERVKVLLG